MLCYDHSLIIPITAVSAMYTYMSKVAYLGYIYIKTICSYTYLKLMMLFKMIRKLAELVPLKYVNDTTVDGYYRMLL